MSLVPRKYIESVLSIGVRNQNDETVWIGTGFFVIKEVVKGRFQPFIITNRHVLKGLRSIVFRLREKDTGKLRELGLSLYDDHGKRLYAVGSDQNIDIAAIILNDDYIRENHLSMSAIDIDAESLSSEEFLDQGGDEGSLVYMLGFPMGLVVEDSTAPICRMGCVARMDQAEISTNRKFLLDIQNFPGNSGSPIISKPEIISIKGSKALKRSVLIGIVNSYKPYREELINAQTKEVVEIRSENSGIASANPVEFIREAVELELINILGPDYRKFYDDYGLGIQEPDPEGAASEQKKH